MHSHLYLFINLEELAHNVQLELTESIEESEVTRKNDAFQMAVKTI